MYRTAPPWSLGTRLEIRGSISQPLTISLRISPCPLLLATLVVDVTYALLQLVSSDFLEYFIGQVSGLERKKKQNRTQLLIHEVCLRCGLKGCARNFPALSSTLFSVCMF